MRDIETIGIIGDGQLGRMLTTPALNLGFNVVVIGTGGENSPASQVGAFQLSESGLYDGDAINGLLNISDVVTWEVEHIGFGTLIAALDQGYNIQPSPHTLKWIKDKLTQKQKLEAANIPVAPYSGELDESNFTGGGPFMVKAREGGFDGRGNLLVPSLDDPRILKQFGDSPVYVEQIVDFKKELSVVAARDMAGRTALYPTVETIHEDSICHTVISPAQIDPELHQQSEEIAHKTMKLIEGAGVFAIEMFVDGNDQVLVNEIAPRVHNSGHHTIESNTTSQFEQHIRAITGMPLGPVDQIVDYAVMVNILGNIESDKIDRTGLDQVLALPNTHPHFYGKTPRPQRKIGHITSLGTDLREVRNNAEQARRFLAGV